ncbi:hypothetical protein FOL46_009921 [Perkinsus olseni]|uniref:beta-N-acetylhexosaminidase n=1 Tax=Perkinsus olseni TaxID=32597 RepID=A0A7J6MJV4_PEROL|nr:hypothetical protein FOL46_009921 [Perkinsus olseni]
MPRQAGPPYTDWLILVATLSSVLGAGTGSCDGLPPQPRLKIWPAPKLIEMRDEVPQFQLPLVGAQRTICKDAEYTALLMETFIGGDKGMPVPTIACDNDFPFVATVPGSYEVLCRNLTCIIRFQDRAGLVYAYGTLGQVHRNHENSTHIFEKDLRIADYPSFPHRGLLIDTGKRYLSLQDIKQTVKLMASVKMNVLHWHLTDDVSFSPNVKQFPRLQKGNPSPFRYSAEDISEVIQYADQYAIVVIPEIDVPGRTQSWIRGYPFLKGHAAYYMDPTSRMTRDMVVGVVMRVADMFAESRPDTRLLHLGGSSVDKAWDTKALEDWTRKYGKFHNKTDLINAWLRSVVARVKRHTDAEIMMWDDFLLEGAAVLTPVNTWQILNHNMEETLKLASSGRFKSLVYSTDFVLSDLGTGYGNDWAKFYDVKFMGDRGGVIKGGEAVVWDSPPRDFPDRFHLSLSIDEASFKGSPISPPQLRFLYHYYGRPTRGHSSPLHVRLSYTPFGKEGSYKILCDIPWCKGRASSYEGAVYLFGTMIQIIEGYPYVNHTVPQKFVIDDYPSFPHRGMLFDTGRHYLPMEILYKNLQLMSFNKMNVLHWHLTDDIAFSLDLTRDRRYSRLQEGNPYPYTYSKREIIKFVKFANLLGIKVIPEIDVPAHTQSWIRGYPELQGHALYWMDPTSSYTKEFVKGVVSEVADIFYGDRRRRETYNGERVVHLGGDETWDAWDTPYLRNWTRDHGCYHNKTDLVDYWLTEVVADIAESTGSKITLWNDFLNDNAEALWPVDTWQIWLYNPAETVELAESGRLPKGSSVLFSQAFYLDALQMTWADFYKVPFRGDCYGVIKGGEACMWGTLRHLSGNLASRSTLECHCGKGASRRYNERR